MDLYANMPWAESFEENCDFCYKYCDYNLNLKYFLYKLVYRAVVVVYKVLKISLCKAKTKLFIR